MKALFKNFLFTLKRFKTASILNILGLSVAFAVAIVIAIQCYYDITYNRYFEKSDTIAALSSRIIKEDRNVDFFSMTFLKDLTDKFPEMQNHCVIGWEPDINVSTKDTNDNPLNISIYPTAVTSSFFDVFNPKIVKGNISNFEEGQDKIVLTEKTANKLFENQDPIGNTIQVKGSNKSYTIIAVYENFAKNALFTEFDAIVNLPFDKDDSQWSYRLYVDMPNGVDASLIKKMNDYGKLKDGKDEISVEFKFDYIKDDYFKESNNKTMFLSLLSIGIIVLLIAYINYLNISVAMIPSRIKSINIHKIMGAGKAKMRLMILGEGIGFTLISLILSLLLISLFADTSFSQLFSADLSLSKNKTIIETLALLFIIIMVLVGIYPSIYASSFPEVIALKGSYSLSAKGSKLRNILIVIQFAAAISISSIAYFIQIQYDYMKNFSTGIEKENIVYIPLKGIKSGLKTLGDEMTKDAKVLDYTLSEFLPGNVGMGWTRNFMDEYVFFTSWPVSTNFLDFFGVKIIGGQNFVASKNDTLSPEQIIVNNRFIDKYNFKAEDILNKEIEGFSKGIIQGVAGDINFESVYFPIEPMAFVVLNGKYRDRRFEYIFLKISATDTPATVEYIKNTWTKFSDEPLDLTFLDQKMNDMYKKEANVSKLISLFGLVTILITVMGLYGLIIFNARYKMKEIAIRKINGSSEKEVILFLNKKTLLLFVIGFALSIPLSYIVIQKWLESFPYKANIPACLFIVSGLLVLLISIVTISWQSWRAATANPVDSLKND